jgi:hypothetical protein
MVFTANIPYTVVFIQHETGITRKDEIVIVGINTRSGRCQYQRRNGNEIYTLPADLDNLLFFHGHNLPFATGGDTSVGIFNFLSANPVRLKNYLIENCRDLTGKEQRINIHKVPKKLLQSLPQTLHHLADRGVESVAQERPFSMVLRDYRATLHHDHGRISMLVTSNSEASAIQQIMAVENCPRCAIVAIKEVAVKYIF